MESLDDIEFINLATARKLSGLSASTIYRAVKAKKFPPPVRLSKQTTKWILAEVIAWRNARIADRDGVAA